MKSKLVATFCLSIIITLACNANSLDSLRTEKVNGQHFIVHKAEPKETLYSISKRYHVTVSDLYKYNKSLQDGLKMYDEILVPYHKKIINQVPNQNNNIHIVAKGETLFGISKAHGMSVDSLAEINHLKKYNLEIGDTLLLSRPYETTNQPTLVAAQSDTLTKTHTVATKETLFGISRMYQVEIAQIQEWNNLSNFDLSIGQVLIIASTENANQEVEEVKIDSTAQSVEVKTPAIDTLYVKTDNSQFKTKVKEKDGTKWIQEEGFAMEIEDTGYTKRYLALHRSAPVGESILIRNEMTNRTIEAIVVGPLPKNALNKKLLLRLSEAAFKALGSLDLKMPITTQYAK